MKRVIQSYVALIALVTLAMVSGTNSAAAAPPAKPSPRPPVKSINRPTMNLPIEFGGYPTTYHMRQVELRNLRAQEGRRLEAIEAARRAKAARQAEEQATKDAIGRQLGMLGQFSFPTPGR